MMPWPGKNSAVSGWKELILVLGVITVLIALPPIVLVSMTDAKALMDGSSGVSLYTDPAMAGDMYDYGNCTYWAAMRRIQIGDPIPEDWGNAADWEWHAILSGYKVDQVPAKYAIMQTPLGANGLGHVAFVESVDPDGTWHISEMNVVGFDEVDNRAMPASAAKYYSFIHDRVQPHGIRTAP